MKIYTKTGDGGETGLFGGGRVSKAHGRVEAYGAIDELNSVIGWAITQQRDEAIGEQLLAVQADLFTIGAQLATPEGSRARRPVVPDLPESRIGELEQWIDELQANLPELRHFILPGGSAPGAALHLARTVCRRAERRVVALRELEAIEPSTITYLNRLSDLLFVLARSVNQQARIAEQPWHRPDR
jgi:cob(I)alamin adenosyltransferase